MRTRERRPAPRRLRVRQRRGGIGELGYCGELCDCSGDYFEPTLVCDEFEDENFEKAFGRKGVCTDAELVIGEAIGCAK
jgi:hypothetical protein